MASSMVTKITKDLKRVPRPSYSRPEHKRLGEDSFFRQNIGSCFVGRNCLLDVDDQGHCCCCWAFSATEAISAARALQNKERIVSFSKQQLVDCLYTYYDKPPLFEDLGEKECFPSHYNMAYKFARDYGLVEERKYPFKEERGECKCPSKKSNNIKIRGYQRISELKLENEKEGIEKLIREQPITCAAIIVPSLKKHRGKGIYMGATEVETEEIEKRMREGEKIGKHAMLIVGYGEEEGVEFYLVKNSWGKGWGYRGFAKIERSVLTNLSYPLI